MTLPLHGLTSIGLFQSKSKVISRSSVKDNPACALS